MKKSAGKYPEKPRFPLSREVVKAALAQASIKDLLDEAFQRGLVRDEQTTPEAESNDEATSYWEDRYWEMLRRRMSQERLQEIRQRHEYASRGPQTIDEEIESQKAERIKHNEYVGGLFDLLHQKRIDQMRERCILRTDATPEFARLGILTTKTLFDHLVIARRDQLDSGTCDIESLWDYLMSTGGYKFASDLVQADLQMPPRVWSSFIYQMVQGVAASFLEIEEDHEEAPEGPYGEGHYKDSNFIN